MSRLILGILWVLISGLSSQVLNGQVEGSFEEFHLKKAEESMRIQDFEEAIKSYKLLGNKSPENLEYDYQVAMCYYKMKKYAKTIKEVHKLIEREPLEPKYYRLLGNAYDVMGEYEKGVDVLNSGIRNLPYSGELYFDLGVIEMLRGEKEKALNNWERGIKAAPFYADNYYWAAKTYAKSNEKIWAIMYAETFLNLERGTERFSEMSKLLSDTYMSLLSEMPQVNLGRLDYSVVPKKERIEQAYDWLIERLTQQGTLTLEEVPDSILNLKGKRIDDEMVFASGKTIELRSENADLQIARDKANRFEEAYLYVFTMLRENGILNIPVSGKLSDGSFSNVKALSFIRDNFVELWMQLYQEEMPVPLFAWQFELHDKGLFDAYNHWLLSNGDPDYFIEWQRIHESEFTLFLETMISQPLKVDVYNYFVRTDYVVE